MGGIPENPSRILKEQNHPPAYGRDLKEEKLEVYAGEPSARIRAGQFFVSRSFRAARTIHPHTGGIISVIRAILEVQNYPPAHGRDEAQTLKTEIHEELSTRVRMG